MLALLVLFDLALLGRGGSYFLILFVTSKSKSDYGFASLIVFSLASLGLGANVCMEI